MFNWPEYVAKYQIYQELKEKNKSGHGEPGDE